MAAARGGLCGACRHAVAVPATSGATYLRCAHPAPPKYPPMPVLRCAHVAPRDVDAGGHPSPAGSRVQDTATASSAPGGGPETDPPA